MWADFLLYHDTRIELAISVCIEGGNFEGALKYAKIHESRAGCKHHRWEEIIAGLVEQDEAIQFV